MNELMAGLIGAVLGMWFTILIVDIKWEHHNTIIKQGCGQYNSQTGDFEWKHPIKK